MSTRRTRHKGVLGEREAAQVWKDHGLELRNLEYAGDHLVILPMVLPSGAWGLHDEVKRQERLRLPEWITQAEAEAPAGTIPVVTFRQSRRKWWSALSLEDLAELVAR